MVRKPRKIVPVELRPAFDQKRLLFVSLPRSTNARVGETQAQHRNRFVLEHSDHHVFGSLNPNGQLAKMLEGVSKDLIQVLGWHLPPPNVYINFGRRLLSARTGKYCNKSPVPLGRG